MKTFFSNLWADLREKRLLPVAVLLLAGLVAIPVVLKKSPEEPPQAQPVAADQPSAPDPKELKGLATVTLEDAAAGDGSSLDTFDPANPFRPPQKVIEEGEEESGAGGAPADGVTLSDEPLESVPGGGDPGLGGSDGGGGSGQTDGSTSGDGPKTDTTEYAYVIDVTFTTNERTLKVEGLERLDMLPNAAAPLLIYLGVTDNAGNAIFLIDSTLQASAEEGTCKPSTVECATLKLGAGSEHTFTNEQGDSYRLRIDEIRKVKIDGSSSTGSGERGKSARAATGSGSPPRRFAIPVLTDLVVESTGGRDDSTGDTKRR